MNLLLKVVTILLIAAWLQNPEPPLLNDRDGEESRRTARQGCLQQF